MWMVEVLDGITTYELRLYARLRVTGRDGRGNLPAWVPRLDMGNWSKTCLSGSYGAKRWRGDEHEAGKAVGVGVGPAGVIVETPTCPALQNPVQLSNAQLPPKTACSFLHPPPSSHGTKNLTDSLLPYISPFCNIGQLHVSPHAKSSGQVGPGSTGVKRAGVRVFASGSSQLRRQPQSSGRPRPLR